MLREGFHNCQPGVATAVNKAIEDFQRLGASVNEISVPMHTYGGDIFKVSIQIFLSLNTINKQYIWAILFDTCLV